MSHTTIRQFFQRLSLETILNASIIAAAVVVLQAGFSILDNPNVSEASAGTIFYGSMMLIMLGTIILNQMYSNIQHRKIKEGYTVE